MITRQAFKTFPILHTVSQGTWVFTGTVAALTFSAVTFFGGEKKKDGHGAFDVGKPELVQSSMDNAEKIRLKNFVPKSPTNV